MRTAQKLILVALAVMSSGLALADGRPGRGGGQWFGPVADAAQDNRAVFQERWREMSPEQREAIRYRLREQWSNVPPEQRKRPNAEMFQRQRSRASDSPPAGWRDEQGYGQGYGTRQWTEPGGRGR